MSSNPLSNETSISLESGNLEELPPLGNLAIVKTKAEVEARFQPVEAFITTVAASRASSTLKAVDNALREARGTAAQSLQHLRRIVKLEHLPKHLQTNPSESLPGQEPEEAIEQLDDGDHYDEACSASEPPILHLLICATDDLNIERIQTLLASDGLPIWQNQQVSISNITIPARPPTSEIQAQQWSQQYWPTVYKKHNPFGPHPSIISHAATEIEENVGEFMDLARKVGQQGSDAGIGECVGAVVVDRSESHKPTTVVVAGDARWNIPGKDSQPKTGSGNVMAHAVMRAIALVANKRLDASSDLRTKRPDTVEDAFTDIPLTSVEKQFYSTLNIKDGGYLCLDLEFYLTHEPCVMCSMALLHSRVGKVVFGTQLVSTGGLTTGVEDENGEGPSGLGYGLFWRPSLNWKFLTWQWTRAGDSPLRSLDELHA